MQKAWILSGAMLITARRKMLSPKKTVLLKSMYNQALSQRNALPMTQCSDVSHHQQRMSELEENLENKFYLAFHIAEEALKGDLAFSRSNSG